MLLIIKQLLILCQRNLWDNLMCHPVKIFYILLTRYVVEVFEPDRHAAADRLEGEEVAESGEGDCVLLAEGVLDGLDAVGVVALQGQLVAQPVVHHGQPGGRRINNGINFVTLTDEIGNRKTKAQKF